MTTGRVPDRTPELTEEERQMAGLDRLLRVQGIERYATFLTVCEGTFFPDGTEDMSGSLIDDRGRVFDFWTAWDAERGEVVFDVWRQVQPEPGLKGNDEYRRARAQVGLDG